MFSKCGCCDERNATIYRNEEMYCHDCHDELVHQDEVCYCTEDMECMACIERYEHQQ